MAGNITAMDLSCVIYKQEPKRPDPQEEARAKLWLDTEGRPSISTERLLGCLDYAFREARRFGIVKLLVGRHGIKSYLTILGSEHPLVNQGEDGSPLPGSPDWEADIRKPRLNGKQVHIVRPKFKRWAFEFELALADSISDEQAIKIITFAGSLYGLGEFRNLGRFGRFHPRRVMVLQAA